METKENELNRRNFFINAALAGAGLAMGSFVLSVSQGTENSSKQMLNSPKSAVGKRKLGKLEVSALGLGCMSMVEGTYNPTPPKQEMIAHLRRAVERGVTYFDTAEVYGIYTSEALVGEALEPFKGKITIATKFGFDIQNNQRMGRLSTPESIKKVVDGSLKRLRIEAIDLYYLHRLDPNVPVEDVAGAVKDLIAAGKVKHWGLSEVSPKTLRKAHAVLTVSALQSEYSMTERVVENQILDTCEEGFEQNMPLLRIVRDWSQRKGITMAQFSLAWLLAQKPFIVPISGTISQQHLTENLGALDVKFAPDELKEIRSEIEKFKLLGVRTPESALVDQ